MAADGIEKGTPKDKAGARALVFWTLVMSVPSQGPSSPLLKASRHSRQDTTSGNAPGPDKGALEAMPCIQGPPWFQLQVLGHAAAGAAPFF